VRCIAQAVTHSLYIDTNQNAFLQSDIHDMFRKWLLLSSLASLFQGVAVTDRLRRVFPMVRGARIYGFSINFLSFLRFLKAAQAARK
jgi:hypothetical protein